MTRLIQTLFAPAVIFALASSLAWSNPSRWVHEWPNTNFSIHSVDLAEIRSGGGRRKTEFPRLTTLHSFPLQTKTGFMTGNRS